MKKNSPAYEFVKLNCFFHLALRKIDFYIFTYTLPTYRLSDKNTQLFVIQWWKKLSGAVTISWSKNATLPLISASLLIKWKTKLTNVPDILDVHDFIHFLESLWSIVSFKDNTLMIDNSNLSLENMDVEKVSRTRASIYFIAGLLANFWKADIPFPQGDKIWKRPIKEHVDGYRDMWYDFIIEDNTLKVSWSGSTDDVEIMAYFAVTATNNLIMWAASRKWKTTIKLAAFEPHVFNLISLLREIGVDIQVRYDHSIIINGWDELKTEVEFEVISDYLQSWTFAIIWALCADDYIDIHRARIEDLGAFLYKLSEAGVKTQDMWDDTLRVFRADSLKATAIQTNIFPGFPTDLMPLYSVLQTQSEWVSSINEILYEWRLNWLVEYESMGWNIKLLNPHTAEISGKAHLIWSKVNSWDLRSGAAMVIAWLIAEWTTKVNNVYWIERWYENLLWKLQSLWADIQEVEDEL